MTNALTKIPWVKTPEGTITIKEALLHAHQLSGLDHFVPALEHSATFRTLTAVAALAIRHSSRPIDLKNGLPSEAVDAALEDIGAAADLHDPTQPFMQQPVRVPTDGSEKALELGRNNQPVKKLNPANHPDQAGEFWAFSTPDAESLSLPEATLALAVFHHFAPAGNNQYDGRKCTMGSPALRFAGVDNSATEMIAIGDSLLETLAMAIPKSYVAGTGLPAWADRTGDHSQTDMGQHPLWNGTWSSNAPACLWENNELVGVRIGGVPEEWYSPAMGTTKASRKNWWDQRNTDDPMYLYIPDDKQQKRLQRLDIGRDQTELTVEWLAESKWSHIQKRGSSHLWAPERGHAILFLRHMIAGTASSPAIRASKTLLGEGATWIPRPETQDQVLDFAGLLQKMHRTVTQPFRALTMGDKRRLDAGSTPLAFPELKDLRDDVSTLYWQNISGVFDAAMRALDEEGALPEETWTNLESASLATFDEFVRANEGNLGSRGEYVRNRVLSNLRSMIRAARRGEDIQ